MISLQDLMQKLEALYQSANFDDYCPNGLQVEGKGEVAKVATGVSATLETVERAVEWGADALIVHHGLMWRGDWPVITGPTRDKVRLLLEAGISLIGYHLPMDANEKVGNNWNAARDLGLQDLESFGGIGVAGKIPPTPIGQWTERVEGYYEHQAHAALGGPESVESVAIISGGAHKSVTEAIEAGFDCFITGSFDEFVWPLARERGIHFLALGHSNTERVGPRALSDRLQKCGVEATFIDVPNPF